MTFEWTKGRANGWAAQILGRATEVSTNKAAPTPKLRCPTGCPRETEGRKLRISLFCPPDGYQGGGGQIFRELMCLESSKPAVSCTALFAQGIPHPRLLRATHRNPPALLLQRLN